jgi:hypothetical protein
MCSGSMRVESEMSAGIARKGDKSVMGRRPRKEGEDRGDWKRGKKLRGMG